MSVGALQTYLRNLPPGRVEDVAELEPLLARCWGDFDGWDESSMEGAKLHRRMESVNWEPPILTFAIERHGATVHGSTTAEVQYWSVNVDTLTASRNEMSRTRYVAQRSSPVDVKPIAAEIVAAILAGKPSPHLKWYSVDDVRVLVADIFPTNDGFKQTQGARRKRLRNAIDEALSANGWKQTTANRFKRAAGIE